MGAPLMNSPGATEFLDAWEQAAGLPPGHRALRLLAVTTAQAEAELCAKSVGQTDRLLLDLRAAAFGERLEAFTRCPHCREAVECELETATLRTEAPPLSSTQATVSVDNWEVTCRLPTALDLDAIRGRIGRDALEELLERCVLSASFAGLTRDIRQAPDKVVAAVGAALEELDPQAATSLEFLCPACNERWSEPLDPGTYLWAELDAWARATLREIDAIARAYGWTESEILALSPRRRRMYLELVNA